MVTDMVKFSNVLQVAEREGKPPEFINELKNLKQAILDEKEKSKRQPRPPTPKGGITICSASEKNSIPHTTLHRWVIKNYIRTISEDSWATYIEESRVVQLANIFKANPVRGSRAVKKFIQKEKDS